MFVIFSQHHSAHKGASNVSLKNVAAILHTVDSKSFSWLKNICTLIARFTGPTWGQSGTDRAQVGPMLAPRTLLSGSILTEIKINYTLSNIELALLAYQFCNDIMFADIRTIHQLLCCGELTHSGLISHMQCSLGGTARWLQLQPSSAWPRPTVSAFQYFRWCAITKSTVSHFLRQIYSLSKEEAL